MYGLLPCIPIFRYVFFLIKSVKRICICDYVKNRIVTCEKCFFRFKNGITELLHWVAQKHTAKITFPLMYFVVTKKHHTAFILQNKLLKSMFIYYYYRILKILSIL